MSSITPIQPSDVVADSRAVINQNFENLNDDKVEVLTDLGLTESAAEYNEAAQNAPTDDEKAAMAGGGDFGNPSASNKFVTEEKLGISGSPQVVTFTSSGSWTKDAGLKYIVVEIQGPGGNGSSVTSTDQGGGGGGAGGYCRKVIPAASLGNSETVTIGSTCT